MMTLVTISSWKINLFRSLNAARRTNFTARLTNRNLSAGNGRSGDQYLLACHERGMSVIVKTNLSEILLEVLRRLIQGRAFYES